MTDQAEVRRTLTAQGFGVMAPPMGDCLYIRGDEYRNADGEEVQPPAEPEPAAGDVLIDLALEKVAEMSTGQLASIAMGENIDHNVMSRVLDNNADELLSEYTNAKIKAYLEAEGVEVGTENKAGLFQLVEALHA